MTYQQPKCIFCNNEVPRKEKRGTKRVICKRKKCQKKKLAKEAAWAREHYRKQREKRRQEGFFAVCEFCGLRFEREMNQGPLKTCSDPECQKKRRRVRRGKKKNNLPKAEKPKPNGKFCQNKKCGAPLYYNYFHCPDCLEELSRHLADPENPHYMCQEGI